MSAKNVRITSNSDENWDIVTNNNNSNEPENGEILDGDQDEVVLNTNQTSQPELSNTSDVSTDSSSASEFDDGYDENLMNGEEDRKRLNELAEIQREIEIFKRIIERELLRNRWKIKRKLELRKQGRAFDNTLKSRKQKGEQEKAKKSHKIKYVQHEASKGCNAQKKRSEDRRKNVELNRKDKRSQAMALLKAERIGSAKREKGSKRQTEKKRKEELRCVMGDKAVKLQTSKVYSDNSGSSVIDDNANHPGKRPCSPSTSAKKYSSEWEDEQQENQRPIYINTCDELNKLRISRFQMEQLINHPMFEHVIINCFVRINIGSRGIEPVYRVAEIVGVVETAKIYNLGQTRTNRGLRLKHGTPESVFRLKFISNQPFSATEFENWRSFCTQENVPMPTLEMSARKQLELQEALNYEYKDEDIAKIIEEKSRFREDPTNFALRKACLIKERNAAILEGDDNVAHHVDLEILGLERRAFELDKTRCNNISSTSYINNRNRKRNIEDVEKALIEEAHANKGLKISNPFTRRITLPKMIFKSLKEADDFGAPQPAAAEDNVESGSECPILKVHSLYDLHDFDIELDKSLPLLTIDIRIKPVKLVAPKRALNLDDYKRKHGFI